MEIKWIQWNKSYKLNREGPGNSYSSHKIKSVLHTVYREWNVTGNIISGFGGSCGEYAEPVTAFWVENRKCTFLMVLWWNRR